MPFGKYAGVELEFVPESYLYWVLDNCHNAYPSLLNAIRVRLGVAEKSPPRRGRSGHPPPEPGVARLRAAVLEAVKRWHRKQGVRHHPDRGGSTEVMQAINDVTDELTKDIEAVFDAADPARKT